MNLVGPPFALLSSHGELLDRTAGDPYARWGVPATRPGPVYALGAAAALVRDNPRRGRRSLTVFGPTGGVELLFIALVEAGIHQQLAVSSVSVPQSAEPVVHRHLSVSGGGDWDWMWTTTAPAATPQERRIVSLDDTTDAQEILRFSGVHSPTAEGDPGEGITQLWLGIRDDSGDLIGCGAMQRLASGYPHLAGITVHTAHRGRGLGRAISAALTREAVRADGVCTLGMYSDNDTARRVYDRLGYRTAYAWASRRLEPPGPTRPS